MCFWLRLEKNDEDEKMINLACRKLETVVLTEI
jgi:hypothetical protein